MFDGIPQKFETPVAEPLEPLTFAHFVAWLEQQPAERAYCWFGGGPCLFEQYGRYCGASYDGVCIALHVDLGETQSAEPGQGYGIASLLPRTFGGALSRARKLLAERNG